MNLGNIVQCLAELVETDLNIKSTKVSQKERETAQHLAGTIGTFADCKQFTYDEETTLDLENQSDDYEESDEEETSLVDEKITSVDDEWKEDEDKDLESQHLKSWSIVENRS